MVVSAALAVALVLPTALDMAGFQPDHCNAHSHGLHLCGVHGDVYPPLLVLGTVLLSVLAARALVLATQLWRASNDVAALLAYGTRAGRLVEVPGHAPLCHATGVFRPRVMLSAGVRARLGSPAVEAALAHEFAHLRRRDPTTLAFLQLSALFGLPGLGLAPAFRAAADEAADTEAAAEFGGVTVADALVRMARFTRERPIPFSPVALALGAHPLEQRVTRLLAGRATPSKARGLAVSAGIAVAALVLAALGAESIHHVVEDLLLAHH